jgi:hypothetical protein
LQCWALARGEKRKKRIKKKKTIEQSFFNETTFFIGFSAS